VRAPPPAPAPAEVFAHGVASGDPLADRVILWTRVTPDGDPAEVAVEWVVARDEACTDVVARGRATTGPERDYTVKVDAAGLPSGATLHYRFDALGSTSPVGRTKTLAEGALERLRLAFTSCSNYPYGYFNVYRAIGERDDLDVVLHLGDYIYEYGNGTYGDGTATGRLPDPLTEMVTLADVRRRHATYKRDPELQLAHRRHPWITVWDDHEVTNDTWRGGAQNHQPEAEGDFIARRDAAVRAYLEWMPIREQDVPHRIYRAFRFGDLADLVMLDTRVWGRDQQAPRDDAAMLADPKRQLLGADQEAWLLERLQASARAKVPWRVLGQQVMMGQLRDENGGVRNADMWDGYDPARRRLLTALQRRKIRDVVVLTGDIHSSWANELALDPFAKDPALRRPLAVELVTPAVSSPSPVPAAEAETSAARVLASHPHIRWVEFIHRGYVELELTRELATARWLHVARVDEPGVPASVARVFDVRRGSAALVPRDA
jgi:alkaline phosphatase D